MTTRWQRLLVRCTLLGICSSWAFASYAVEEVAPPLPPADVQAAGSSETVIVAGGETLQAAWSDALSVDPDLEASRWKSSAAQRGLYAARAERLPSLSARASYSVFDNPLTINAPLPPVVPGLNAASVTVNQREFFLGGVRATVTLVE